MSPTRRNRDSVFSLRSKLQGPQIFTIPRLERLEDRWNPTGIGQSIGHGLGQSIEPTRATSDVAIVDAELLGQLPEAELRGSKVIAIDGKSDPIDQIDRALEGLKNISVLRIISHGESGAIWLGGQRISAETLKARTSEIATWGHSLNADADVLLYGCSVAATQPGVDLIDSLAEMTGADVAASINPTGFGGDTTLEVATGSLESALKAGIVDWSQKRTNLAFTNLNSATFTAEEGNTFTLFSDLPGKPTFELVSGKLPQGIVFDGGGGYFWGIPVSTSVGTYSLRWKATFGNQSETQDFQLNVVPRPITYKSQYAILERNALGNINAFAALKQDGSIFSWGWDQWGGGGHPIDKGYVNLVANDHGFAALKSDGTIASWGAPKGSPSHAPIDSGYIKIIPFDDSFVAVKSDGSFSAWIIDTEWSIRPPTTKGFVQFVKTDRGNYAALNQNGTIATWGTTEEDWSIAAHQGNGFTRIFSNDTALAALRTDGSVVAWGSNTGGGIGAPKDKGYVSIFPLGSAFAALKSDGSIVTWGDTFDWDVAPPTGNGFTRIISNTGAFVAIKTDGSLVSWGNSNRGGQGAPTGNGYVSVVANYDAFAALKQDGTITAWGNPTKGGLGAPTGKGYTQLYSNPNAFVAINSDGYLAAWGAASNGGAHAPTGGGFSRIFPNEFGFAGLTQDGRIYSWGGYDLGSGFDYPPEGSGFTDIVASTRSFAGLNADGSIEAWGNGGDSVGAPSEKGFVTIAIARERSPWFSTTAQTQLFAQKGAKVRYQIPVEGTPLPEFTLMQGKLPPGLTLDSRTGVISGTAPSNPAGAFSFSISINNGYGKATKSFSIAFTTPPVLSAVAKASFPTEKPGSYRLPLGQSMTSFEFQLIGNNRPLPEGLQFDPVTGVVSGTPLPGQGGSYQFTCAIANWISPLAQQTFTLTVPEAPKFKNLDSTEFFINQGNTFTLLSLGYPIPTLKIASGAFPKGIAFDAKTGVIAGTAAQGSAGIYRASFSLANGIGSPVTQTLTITVRNSLSPDQRNSTGPLQSKFNVVNNGAFAALKSDGSIVAWGSPEHGGVGYPTDNGYVEIYPSSKAFAALKADGTIFAWGDDENGLTHSPTDGGYTAIYSNEHAFVAIKKDGKLSAWGNPFYGGTGAPIKNGYIQVVSNNSAFAALRNDGSISTWGYGPYGGTGGPAGIGFVKIFSTYGAFATLKADGSVVAWGIAIQGGANAPKDKGIIQVYSNSQAFAALKSDGSVLTWGSASYLGNSAPPDKGYTSLYPFPGGFFAVKSDGSFSTITGSQSIFSKASNLTSIFAMDNYLPFYVGITNDKTIVSLYRYANIEFQTGATYINFVGNLGGLAAISSDGRLSTWGPIGPGTSDVPADDGYVQLFGNLKSFAAIKADGTISTWGDATTGGSGGPTGSGFVSLAVPLEQAPWFTFEAKANQTANVGEFFSYQPPVRGLPAASYAIVNGSLPLGISLNNQTGLLSGKPSKAGTYTFTLAASNGAGVPAVKEFTIQVVQPVNDPPVGADKTAALFEDQVYIFGEFDFGFADPLDMPANALASIKIATLPAKGSLTLSGKLVVVNQFVAVNDLRAGKLVYRPAANGSGEAYASFTFQIRDNGGTKFGGIDLSVNTNRITFNVSPVNDAPSGSNKAFMVSKNAPLILTLADFGFTDSKDPVPNDLNRVQFVTVPASGKGHLTLDGTVVKASTFVTAADIAAGKLNYFLPSAAKGKAFATISFKVEDDGGTANGGKNLALAANVLTINVA